MRSRRRAATFCRMRPRSAPVIAPQPRWASRASSTALFTSASPRWRCRPAPRRSPGRSCEGLGAGRERQVGAADMARQHGHVRAAPARRLCPRCQRRTGARDLLVGEGGGDGAGREAVGLGDLGQRRAQPDAVDHGGDRHGDALRVLRVAETLEVVAQVGQHPPLIGALHPLEADGMEHLPPEGEPDRAGPRVELFRSEIGVDHGLDALARPLGALETQPGAGGDAVGEVAQGGFEKAVLVAEIVRDERGHDARAPRDLRQAGGGEADIGKASIVASISWRRRWSSAPNRETLSIRAIFHLRGREGDSRD